ncbi:MAG: gliding motility-associated C-terminal domain-containing protein, partial [Cyclobacteriaceae bacterium]|nr:gliding motility-associated C-terminal domain-containing protein [Cyclobacteriaceae bacterium]
EVRLWNYSRSINEIRSNMCKKLIANSNGLIGYWNFNNEAPGNKVILDSSQSNFNGNIVSNLTIQYSGAAIGDFSVFNYTNNWPGQILTLPVDNIIVTLDNIMGSQLGLHLYGVQEPPNYQPTGQTPTFYIGVFTGDYRAINSNYHLKVSNYLQAFSRLNNTVSNWIKNNSVVASLGHLDLTDTQYHQEYSFSCSERLPVLFQDTSLCVGNIYNVILPAEYEYKLNGNIVPNSFSISQAGNYELAFFNDCFTEKLNIDVKFLDVPILDIATNFLVCKNEKISVKPNQHTYNLLWSTQENTDSIELYDTGIYWVEAFNSCHSVKKEFRVSPAYFEEEIELYNVITPNNDGQNDLLILPNEIETADIVVVNRWGVNVYENKDYENNWDGGKLSNGIYFYLVKDKCSKKSYKGILNILR